MATIRDLANQKLAISIVSLHGKQEVPSSQPIVKALLLPLLSYGATVLIHFYTLPGF